MKPIRIAAAQFEVKNGDKEYNLAAMSRLVDEAVRQKADVVSFPEVCIPAYSFVRRESREVIHELSETVPDGPSVQRLKQMAIRKEFPPKAPKMFSLDGVCMTKNPERCSCGQHCNNDWKRAQMKQMRELNCLYELRY